MNRSRISERHYFLAMAIPIVIVASWYLDTKSGAQRTAKKKQNKIISCGTNSYMKVGIDMFADNSIEKTDDNDPSMNEKNEGKNEWLFTSSHPCSHRTGPGVAICMLAGHKRRFLKIQAFHTYEAEHFYS